MNKNILLSICLLLIAMVGIGCVSAADNNTADMNNPSQMTVDQHTHNTNTVNEINNTHAVSKKVDKNIVPEKTTDNIKTAPSTNNTVSQNQNNNNTKNNLNEPKLNIKGPKKSTLNITGPKNTDSLKIKSPKQIEKKVGFKEKMISIWEAIKDPSTLRKLIKKTQ